MNLKNVLPSRWRVGWLASLVLLALFSSTAWAEGEFVEGSLLAQFKGDVAVNSLETKAALSAMGVETQEYFEFINAYVLRVDNSVSSTTGAIDALNQSGLVEYAEPNYILHAIATTPNDPSYNKLWGMNNTGQTGGTKDADIDAPEAWDIQKDASGIVVATIDTGIDYNHPDLKANMWVNPGETPGNGKDDDGNGYVDDVHGINCIKNNGNPMDDHYHGTHVAGTIGAVGNNNVGVVGVAWKVKHMALKFLSSSGSGSTSDAIQCIEYMVKMKTKYGVNVKLSNNSWGGGGYSTAMFNAIKASGAAGQLFMAAAGNANNNNDSRPSYPASYNLANIVAIGATDHNDKKASFSNYGKTSVDLGAPGVNIYSTSPGNSYRTLNGTSMATPHVSGAAAVLWANKTSLTPAQVKQCLMDSVDKKTSLTPYWVSGGRLNLYNALTKCGGGPPPAAKQISPNGAINDSTPPYIWNAVPTATWYYLWVNDSTGNKIKWWYSAKQAGCGTGTGTCLVRPSTSLADGNAKWWIKTWNSKGSKWNSGMSFTVKAVPPVAAKLISPVDTISDSTPTYVWNAVSNSSWYYLWVNDSTGNKIRKWYTAMQAGCGAGTDTCSVTPSTKLANGNGRWWVKTWNRKGSKWSSSLSFTVKAVPPPKPVLKSPTGNITDSTPTYMWTGSPKVTWYYLWVSQEGGSSNATEENLELNELLPNPPQDDVSIAAKPVIKKWYTAAQAGCAGGSDCKVTPTTQLKDGNYKWYIRTWNSKGFGDWSVPLLFTLKTPVTCGFNEQFSGSSAPNWKQDRGTWTESGGSFHSNGTGKVDLSTTTYNVGTATFKDFEYKARLWRDGSNSSTNRLIIRASGAMDSIGQFKNQYVFQYTRDGGFSVWKRVNGVDIALISWGSSSAINKGSAWNELRVVANGSSFKYYINNKLVWSGSDSSLQTGRVGVAFYTSPSSGQKLFIDWATLTCQGGTNLSDAYEGISAEINEFSSPTTGNSLESE